MSLLKKKISKLICPSCETAIGIKCGGCHRPMSPERYSAGVSQRYVCSCGTKCNKLTCPKCGHTDEPFEFSCGSEIGVFDTDPRSTYPLGQGS